MGFGRAGQAQEGAGRGAARDEAARQRGGPQGLDQDFRGI